MNPKQQHPLNSPLPALTTHKLSPEEKDYLDCTTGHRAVPKRLLGECLQTPTEIKDPYRSLSDKNDSLRDQNGTLPRENCTIGENNSEENSITVLRLPIMETHNVVPVWPPQ